MQLYPPGQIFPSLELANAAKARTRGLEVDGTLAVSSAAKLTLAAAYIDARFLDFKAGPAYPGQTTADGAVITGFDANGAPVFAQGQSGKPRPDAPKFKFTLGIDPELAPAGWPVRLNLNAQYAYRTSALLQGNQNPKTCSRALAS